MGNGWIFCAEWFLNHVKYLLNKCSFRGWSCLTMPMVVVCSAWSTKALHFYAENFEIPCQVKGNVGVTPYMKLFVCVRLTL